MRSVTNRDVETVMTRSLFASIQNTITFTFLDNLVLTLLLAALLLLSPLLDISSLVARHGLPAGLLFVATARGLGDDDSFLHMHRSQQILGNDIQIVNPITACQVIETDTSDVDLSLVAFHAAALILGLVENREDEIIALAIDIIRKLALIEAVLAAI